MEGITYPEHLAPGVSLDSRFRAGMLKVEPLPSLVHKISLVARPQVEIRTSHWKPVINPVMDINTDDLPMKKFPYPEPLEQSVLGVLAAIRTDETDRLKCPTRTSQLYYDAESWNRQSNGCHFGHGYRPAGEFSSDDRLGLDDCGLGRHILSPAKILRQGFA